jgi:hypothetical protein
MLKQQTLIQFTSIQLLKQFAEGIESTNIEINMEHKTLLCDCSSQELEWLSLYNGKILEIVIEKKPK